MATLRPVYCVKPTIVTEVGNDMTIAREEVFGAVFGIIGLAAPTYSPSARSSRTMLRHSPAAGMVLINGTCEDLEAPFGG
jgi:acyl-CoA reductase-like NAD-dependent aldehyde dehydrogenase